MSDHNDTNCVEKRKNKKKNKTNKMKETKPEKPDKIFNNYKLACDTPLTISIMM